MAKAPQQADRDRLDLAAALAHQLAQPLHVEGPQHAVRTRALGHRHAQLRWHERRRARGTEAVELCARLAAELLEIGEALGGEQRGARDLPLEQRVRADGHPVHEAVHVRGGRARGVERSVNGAQHALRLVLGRAWGLRRYEAVAGEQRGVGEGSADVHPEQHGWEGSRAHEGRGADPCQRPSRPRVSCGSPPLCGSRSLHLDFQSGLAEAKRYAAVTAKSSSRCLCDGQYLLPGRGMRWHAVPLRVLAWHESGLPSSDTPSCMCRSTYSTASAT